MKLKKFYLTTAIDIDSELNFTVVAFHLEVFFKKKKIVYKYIIKE